MKTPTREQWDAWVETLKTGDVVSVYYSVNWVHIHDAKVKITPTGKIFLCHLDGTRRSRDRTDWRRYTVRVLGGGDRRIYKHQTRTS
jgi:hypothetical protein